MSSWLKKDEEKFGLAHKMVKLGFRRRIITTSLKVSDRLVSYLKGAYEAEELTTGRFKSSVTIIANHSRKIEATNFMTIYLRRAKDPSNIDKIDDVIAAYEIYRELNIKLREKTKTEVMLDANDAWILARDFRSDVLSMLKCNHCSNYFISQYISVQRYRKHTCPFCEKDMFA